MKLKKDKKFPADFSGIIISLASPESILDRSFGEVMQPETINYRTYKPDMKGLFCEKIFGPIKDWECHCGKYSKIRYRGIVCDKCGVEVTEKKVRRERTGHIELVVPVAHIWYFKSLPNKIGHLLGLPTKKLDQIIYYERYVVIQPGIKAEEGISYMDFLTEEEYLDIIDKLPRENRFLDDHDPNKFIAKMGGEALELLLSRLELDQLSFTLRDKVANETSQQRKLDTLKRLKIVEAFRGAQNRIENKPEWMTIRMISVIPPELRPLVPLEGGKFASSDLNDLYRKVIIRNNRLKRLIAVKAPEVILRNEKRMLQEAVDALFDNSKRSNTTFLEGNRSLKSLSDMLKGKQGRFRQNLLGKRVDYSGRSVIVVGPELQLHECGLPKDMAVELFKPFIIRKLIERGIVKTVKSAKKIVDSKIPVVWDILENLLKSHPVLLNRAPTLHKLGIQAFQPKFVEGKAIHLHPLVCTAFNADFDGDQMAVHVPLGQEAITEASLLILSSYNILSPSNGMPIVVPSKDIVLGLYYLTKGSKGTLGHPVKGEGMVFASIQEVVLAIDNGKVAKHAHIKIKTSIKQDGKLIKKIISTVAGRAIFNQCVPEELGFVDELLTSKKLQTITAEVYQQTDVVRTAMFLDDIKNLGFEFSSQSGLTMGLDDIKIPREKAELIQKAKKNIEVVLANYLMGLITDNERYNQVIDVWTHINTRITNILMQELEEDQQGFNPIYMMMHSGARGSREQVRQLGGMRGLMAKPRKSLSGSTNEIIETPILSNFKEGLDVFEYFISSHGARKGLADTALKTADAGYLTRRLVDVAQDLTITEEDCGTLRGRMIKALKEDNEIVEVLSERILGRTTVHDVYNSMNNLLIAAGEQITRSIALKFDQANIEEVEIRSVLTCESKDGICAKCYGSNLATGKMVQRGEAVGVIGAQSIGEPGTQLTLRTFHVGGTASNISTESGIYSKFDGIIATEEIKTIKTTNSEGDNIDVVIGRYGELKITDPKSKKVLISYHMPYGAYLKVKKGEKIKQGQELAYWDPYNAVILSTMDGKIQFKDIVVGVTFKEEYDEQAGHTEKVIIDSKDKIKNPSIVLSNQKEEKLSYALPVGAYIIVAEGMKVKAGQVLAKIPRVMSKSKDITGGLPRVTELFEVRNPSSPATISEIDGIVTYGGIKRGNREILIESKSGIKKKYLISLLQHILVQDNDYVKSGYPLSDGPIAPADILTIQGPSVVQEYLVNEIQNVYRLQGVKIHDKHIEIIVRQMMQKVEVVESGDTTFLPGQIIDKFIFREENYKIFNKKLVTDIGDSKLLQLGQIVSVRKLKDENANLKRQDLKLVQVRDIETAVSQTKLQGITQASLGTESFLSAASFQETTKVLSWAAIQGKQDMLKGLKENIIVGHLIPSGTGLEKYGKLIFGSKEEYQSLVTQEATMA